MASLFDQRLEGQPEPGMDPRRGDLRRRLKDESSMVEVRMGQLEIDTSAYRGRRDQEVEIEGPWSPQIFSVPLATGSGFEFATALEQ